MKIIQRARGCGKTFEIIQLAAKHDGYIVVRDKATVARVAQQARDMKLKISFPLTYEEFIRREYHPSGVDQVFIDDVDAMIQQMAMVPVRAVSLGLSDDDESNWVKVR